jgi:hypothetical protein
MSRLAKTDTMFAHMALHLAVGLSLSARRVGSAIIEHYNKRTGQCDPSIERLARMLGIDRATVMRATRELCQADGLFERVTHGGRSHRTAYLPRWDRLNMIVDDWDLRMKDGSAPTNVAKPRRSRSQNCDVEGRNIATQTDRRNRQKKPKAAVSLSDDGGEQPSPPHQRQGRKGLQSDGALPQRQGFLVQAIAGGKGVSRTDAAEAAAVRRIIDPVRRSNSALAYRIDTEATPEMLAEATTIEVARRGAGLPHLVNALDEQALRALQMAADRGQPTETGPSGPPLPAGTGGPGISVCEVNFIGKAN